MSQGPSTSRPLFIFPATRGRDDLGSVIKKRIDEIASVPPGSWSPPDESLGSITFSAVRKNLLINAALMKNPHGPNPSPKLYSFVVYDTNDTSKALHAFNLIAPEIEISKRPSIAQNVINALRNLIVIDHKDLDAIDGFPPREENHSAFCRMSRVMLSAFYTQVPEEHREDASHELEAWYQVYEKYWSIEMSDRSHLQNKFQENVSPEILALLPSMTAAKSETRHDIVTLEHPHCMQEDMYHDAMRSLQSIAALQAFSKHYAQS